MRGEFHPEILRGSPERERKTREGWVKSAVFYLLSVNISKTVADTARLSGLYIWFRQVL